MSWREVVGGKGIEARTIRDLLKLAWAKARRDSVWSGFQRLPERPMLTVNAQPAWRHAGKGLLPNGHSFKERQGTYIVRRIARGLTLPGDFLGGSVLRSLHSTRLLKT